MGTWIKWGLFYFLEHARLTVIPRYSEGPRVPEGRRIVATGEAASVLTMPRNPWNMRPIPSPRRGEGDVGLQGDAAARSSPASLRDGCFVFQVTMGSSRRA